MEFSPVSNIFGPVPQLNEFQLNSIKQRDVVNEIDPSKKIDNNSEPKEVIGIQKNKIDEKKVNEVKKGDFSTYNEVTLENISFGYNSKSKDFFIKVKRGDFEAQYPTDEMMRLKVFLSNANANEKASKAS